MGHSRRWEWTSCEEGYRSAVFLAGYLLVRQPAVPTCVWHSSIASDGEGIDYCKCKEGALDDVAAIRQSCIHNLLSLPLSLFPDRMLYVTESLRLSSSMLIGVRAARPSLHQWGMWRTSTRTMWTSSHWMAWRRATRTCFGPSRWMVFPTWPSLLRCDVASTYPCCTLFDSGDVEYKLIKTYSIFIAPSCIL